MRMRNVLLVFVVLALICGTGFKSGAWAQQSTPPAYDQKTIAFIRQQAANGNAEAQESLGGLYEFGRHGVPQDYAQAAAWYRKAA